MSKTVFVYALVCPDSGEVRYIGRSEKPETRFVSHLKGYGKSSKSEWINSLAKNGKQPDLVILEEVSIKYQVESETKWIRHYQSIGANLTNMKTIGNGTKASGTEFKMMSIRLPIEMMEWLERRATANYRSVNREIEHVLDNIMKDASTPRYKLGVAQLCANGTHLFINDSPLMSDFCNCGMFIFGEVR